MNERTRTGLEILRAAVLMGILGDVLLRQTPWGLNVLLFIAALVAALVMLTVRRRIEFWTPQLLGLNAALVVFAAMFVWRDSIELRVFDTFAILLILAVISLQSLNIQPQIAGAFHYIAGTIWSGINAAFSPFLLVFSDVEWKSVQQTGFTRHLIPLLRGILIAAPLLLIFGALFVAADSAFEGIVDRTFSFLPETVIEHFFFFGFFAWITAGFLRGAFIGISKQPAISIVPPESESEPAKPQNLSVTDITDEEEKTQQTAESRSTNSFANFDNSVFPHGFTLGAVEVSVILGLINLLFLGFVIVQIPYLFGGFELVQNTPDFKLAEYARRGFGELVAVSALVLPVLMVSHWLLRKDGSSNGRIFKVLAVIQIGLLFVIMISAAQRLLLLTGNLGYGLTTVRFYPMAFMVLLAMIFLWFGATVLRGNRHHFAWGALWIALLVLGTLHVFNPDDFIVKTNLKLMQEGRDFDGDYNASLSDDAVPELLSGFQQMDGDDKCDVARRLSFRFTQQKGESDFRSFNLSRSRAKELLDDYLSELRSVGDCETY
ncbi:MAG: DUF4173 domain-containing protein [Pyrinomonadaceae bacterium]|nr:DUF4173 domain-containing protein [Pyrinomonadaceae bacterium]